MHFSLSKKSLIKILSFFTLIFSLFSLEANTVQKETPHGASLSRFTEKTLTENGFFPARIQIANTGQDEFPYSVALRIDGTPETEALPPSEETLKSTVIIDITQEDFFEFTEEILSLIKTVFDGNFGYTVEFFFPALDEHIYGRQSALTGTEKYTSSLENSLSSCALILDFGESETNRILTTGKNISTPLWLFRRIADSFIKTHTEYENPQQFLSLYRVGLLKGDETMDSFFKNSIPCCKIMIKKDGNLDAIKTFLNEYTVNGTDEWDSHYSFIRLPYPLRPFWITEKMFVLALELFAVVAIFILCSFSFVGKSKIRYKREFRNSWFLMPLTILLSFASLYIGQTFSSLPFFDEKNLVIQFGIKIITSMALLSVIFIIQQRMKIPVTQFAYGYILSIFAVINVFIFSTVDLLFFLLFFIEYVIILSFRKVRKIGFMIFAMIIMLVPFLPYITTLISTADSAELSKFVFSSAKFNLILSFILFPFQIMWFRILIRLNIFRNAGNFSRRRVAFFGTVMIFSIAFITIISAVFAEKFLRKSENKREEITFIEIHDSRLGISDIKSEFMGLSTHNLKISTDEKVLRYEISLISKTGQPLYDSLYDYSLKNDSHTVEFLLPDFPPPEITVNFNCDSDTTSTARIRAVFLTDEKNVLKTETKEVLIYGN